MMVGCPGFPANNISCVKGRYDKSFNGFSETPYGLPFLIYRVLGAPGYALSKVPPGISTDSHIGMHPSLYVAFPHMQ